MIMITSLNNDKNYYLQFAKNRKIMIFKLK